MSVKIPTYITTEDVLINLDKTLPAGSFVKPIDTRYLPRHILERHASSWRDSEMMYVYCHYGIIRIDKFKVREA